MGITLLLYIFLILCSQEQKPTYFIPPCCGTFVQGDKELITLPKIKLISQLDTTNLIYGYNTFYIWIQHNLYLDTTNFIFG